MRRYEFALLQYVHDPVAGEMANIGVVVFDTERRRLFVRTSERYRRVSEFFRITDTRGYTAMVRHLEQAFQDVEAQLRQPSALVRSPESLQDILAAVAPDPDSCIRPSMVMAGVQDDVEKRFGELYAEFVGRYERTDREYRNEDAIRRDFDARLVRAGLIHRVTFQFPINSRNYRWAFHAGWRARAADAALASIQVLEPISFDLIDEGKILEKATHWNGRLYTLLADNVFQVTAVLAKPEGKKLDRAFDQAYRILRGNPALRELVVEEAPEQALELIRKDTEETSEG